MPMLTVKLVVIGASGVGKTSLRGQYISGRFSTGYRATIGADFITKNIPHPTLPGESVALQIWDTAGQERFSSLSSAFFRGADAALLMFDVNDPDTLDALKKWWVVFKENAPLADGEADGYCCVVVGNKMDVVNEGRSRVSKQEALRFLDELVPPSSVELEAEAEDNPMSASQLTARIPTIGMPIRTSLANPDLNPDPSTINIALSVSPSYSHLRSYSSYSPSGPDCKRFRKSRSRSSSRFRQGTMTTSHTNVTIYHTPSSSLFDVYQSARASPEPSSYYASYRGRSVSSSPTRVPRRMPSSSSTSSGSVLTLTPSLFARGMNRTAITTPPTPPPDSPVPSPERGPKLFFTSAKTGEGVSDVFEYIAQRVVRRWAHEEAMEARQGDVSPSETVRLGLEGTGTPRGRPQGSCCST